MRVSCHLSLTLPLLHFVPKFSIQKIKGGEKTSAGARKKSAIMDFINEFSANQPGIKATSRPKIHNVYYKRQATSIDKGTFFGNPRIQCGNTRLHATLATLLSGACEVMLGQCVVNTVVKRKKGGEG